MKSFCITFQCSILLFLMAFVLPVKAQTTTTTDVALTAIFSNANTPVNQQVVLTIVLQNRSATTAQNIYVNIPAVSGLSFTSATMPLTSNRVWRVQSLTRNQSQVLRITYQRTVGTALQVIPQVISVTPRDANVANNRALANLNPITPANSPIVCSRGQIPNATGTACICPTGTSWNGTGCVNTTSVCIAPRFLGTSGQCECPASQTWNGTTCVDKCPAPRFLGTSGQCECPQAQQWNGSTCVDRCPAPQYWTPNGCVNPNTPPTCPTGTTWNGTVCAPNQTGTTCTYPRFLGTSGQCECPASQTWNGSTCADKCPAPRFWNGSTCECPQAQQWNGSTCVDRCPTPQYWTPNGCVAPNQSPNWGGNNVNLVMSGATANLTFGCASGTFSGILPASGVFNFTGTYTQLSGAQQVDANGNPILPTPVSATYNGMINGNIMTLIVTTASGSAGQTYQLTNGVQGNIQFCQ